MTKKIEESISSTKAIEDLKETSVHVKALDLLDKNKVRGASLTRPLAFLSVQNKSHLRLYDGPDSDSEKVS